MAPPRPKFPTSTPPAYLREAEEEAIARLLVPPTTLEQLAEWRAKAVARRSLAPPSAPPKPKKR
jgi:hypothetical protein